MNFRQLYYFTVLAQELSFTRAAQRLHISQPPLSRQIAELEASLNVKLFMRSSRRVELTDAGHAFLQDVQAVFSRLQNAAQRAQSIEQGLEGRIDVGLSGSHFMGPLPAFMERFSREYPKVVVALTEMVPADQINALIERRIDVNISRVPTEDSLLQSIPLWRDPVVVAMLKGHPLSAHQIVSIGQLKGERLVALQPNSSKFAGVLNQRFSVLGLSENIVQVVAQVPAQVCLVAAGLGLAIVPLSVCKRFPELAWCYLNEPDLSTDVYAVMRRDVNKPALSTFLDTLKKPLPTTKDTLCAATPHPTPG